MYLTRTLTDLSLPMIGQEFGGRDHTTVMYAINKIDTRIKKDAEFSIEVQGLIKEIKKIVLWIDLHLIKIFSTTY